MFNLLFDDLNDHAKYVKLAETEKEINAAIELRYKYICQWNAYEKDNGCAQSSIGDQFDSCCKYIIHQDEEGNVNGVLRLIPHNEHGFFLERYIDIHKNLDVNEKTVELAELEVHPDHRTNPLILIRIILFATKYLIETGYTSACSINVEQTSQLKSRLGFEKVGDKIMTTWDKEMQFFVLRDISHGVGEFVRTLPRQFRKNATQFFFGH